MIATHRLASGDEQRWIHLLTPEAAQLPDPEAFETWRNQVRGLSAMGLIEVQAVMPAAAPDGPATAVLLINPQGSHRTIVAAAGALTDDALQLAVGEVMARSEAVTWSAEAGPDWAERLAGLGVRAFLHQTFVNDLAVTARVVLPVQPPDPAVVPWNDAWAPEVVQLVAAHNAGTLAGLMLALPDVPTPARITALVERIFAPGGGLRRDASCFYVVDGEPAGVILLTDPPGGPPLLFELVVHPRARGRMAGRALVRAAQRALIAAGETQMGFWTTQDNAGVHRIYEPDEVTVTETRACAYWLRDARV